MRIDKKSLIVLAILAAAMLLLCVLLLSGLIPLGSGMTDETSAPNNTADSEPVFGGGDGENQLPDRSEEVRAAYTEKKDYNRQLADYFTALKTEDAQLLLALYHPDYWGGDENGLSAALYLMEENVVELALPADSTYTITQEYAPDKDTRAALLLYYPDLPISNMIALDVEYTLDGDTLYMSCTFFETGGAWYLFEDIGQLNY